MLELCLVEMSVFVAKIGQAGSDHCYYHIVLYALDGRGLAVSKVQGVAVGRTPR